MSMSESPLKTSTKKPTLNPALREFWKAPARNKVLYGGRSSSKSWDAAGFAVFLAANYKVKFLCTRQFQNKITDSVYTLLKIQIDRFGLSDEFQILNSSIKHKETGSEFVFYGLWRHIGEIKSLEGVDVCWIEEAHGLTEEQWEILEPTVRAEGSQFWIIFNPKLVTDFVYRRFVTNTPPDTVKRKINYTENPFLSETIQKVIAAKKAEDEAAYRHTYLGEPLEDDDLSIIKRTWITASIDAHKKLGIEPLGAKRIGFDVADSGDDKNAKTHTHGLLAYHVDEWEGGEDELLKTATRVYRAAVREGASIDYDSIGVGAFAGSHFKALNEQNQTKVEYFKFIASGEVVNPNEPADKDNPKSPSNKNFYCNLKAQTWDMVAARFRNTYNAVVNGQKFDQSEMISLSSEIEDLETLIDELCVVRKDFDNNGRFKAESKKDLAKRGIKSPNRADSLIQAYAPRTVKKQIKSGIMPGAW